MATSIQDLSARLTTLSDSNKTTIQLIQRLARLSSANNQSSPSASYYADGSEDIQAELTSDISESLRSQDDDFELLRQEIEWFESSSAAWTRRQDQEWTRLSVQTAKLEEDLRRYGQNFPQATSPQNRE
jgi:protein transport protein SEC20